MTLLFVLLLAIPSFSYQIVSQSVGQVADSVVTSREVKASTIIENILYPSKSTKTAYELKDDYPEFRQAVTAVLLESVVALEAENFNVVSITDEELSKALAKVQKEAMTKSYWTKLEMTPKEVRDLVIRKITAKRFLTFKTESLSGVITDGEARRYYERNRSKFSGHSFEAFSSNIKSFLAQQQLEERIRSWFEVIKRKYRVRNFIADQGA